MKKMAQKNKKCPACGSTKTYKTKHGGLFCKKCGYSNDPGENNLNFTTYKTKNENIKRNR